MNEVKISGTMFRCWKIETKTNTPMVKFLLDAGQAGRFMVMGFGNLAESVEALPDGAELTVTGQLKVNSWRGDDNVWRNEVTIFAWKLSIGDREIQYSKAPSAQEQAQVQQQEKRRGQPPVLDTGANLPF
jgi:single-stranded DNA-binding protein